MSSTYLAARFTCSRPWTTLVVLCDGRIVCGCTDPCARLVLGDAMLDFDLFTRVVEEAAP